MPKFLIVNRDYRVTIPDDWSAIDAAIADNMGYEDAQVVRSSDAAIATFMVCQYEADNQVMTPFVQPIDVVVNEVEPALKREPSELDRQVRMARMTLDWFANVNDAEAAAQVPWRVYMAVGDYLVKCDYDIAVDDLKVGLVNLKHVALVALDVLRLAYDSEFSGLSATTDEPPDPRIVSSDELEMDRLNDYGVPRSTCIHVGLFAGPPQKYEGVANPTEHCDRCNRDIPISQL